MGSGWEVVLFFGVASLFFVFCFCCGEKVGYCFFPSLSAFSLVLPQLSPKSLKCVFLLLLLENFGGLSEKGKREKLFLLAHFFSSQTLCLRGKKGRERVSLSPTLLSSPLSLSLITASRPRSSSRRASPTWRPLERRAPPRQCPPRPRRRPRARRASRAAPRAPCAAGRWGRACA